MFNFHSLVPTRNDNHLHLQLIAFTPVLLLSLSGGMELRAISEQQTEITWIIDTFIDPLSVERVCDDDEWTFN